MRWRVRLIRWPRAEKSLDVSHVYFPYEEANSKCCPCYFATFLRTFKSLMKTYLQEKFKNLSHFQQLRALSLQTQQGHFYPWPFWLEIFQQLQQLLELHVRTIRHSTNQTCRANLFQLSWAGSHVGSVLRPSAVLITVYICLSTSLIQ